MIFEGNDDERCFLCNEPATQRAYFYTSELPSGAKRMVLYCEDHALIATHAANCPRYIRPLPSWTRHLQDAERADQQEAIRRLHRDQLAMDFGS